MHWQNQNKFLLRRYVQDKTAPTTEQYKDLIWMHLNWLITILNFAVCKLNAVLLHPTTTPIKHKYLKKICQKSQGFSQNWIKKIYNILYM